MGFMKSLVFGLFFLGVIAQAQVVWNIDQTVSVPINQWRIECTDIASSGDSFSSNIRLLWPEYAALGGQNTYYSNYGLRASNEPINGSCQEIVSKYIELAAKKGGVLSAHLVAKREVKEILHCDISMRYDDECKNPRTIKVLREHLTLTFPDGLTFGAD